MPEPRATTIRFADPVYARLEHAAEQTGLTINAIVTVAALEWLDEHVPDRPASPSHLSGGLCDLPRSFWRGVFRGRGRGAARPYDRLTGRAKHALALAHDEATEAHASLTPEFLLLGLALEGGGLAARALADAGPSADALRTQALAAPEEAQASMPSPALKQAIESAFDEAKALGHDYIGTEHLLLGLLRDARFADIAPSVRSALTRLLVQPAGGPPSGE